MTTQVQDRRRRSARITLVAPVVAGIALAALVAVNAFGGGRGSDGAGAPPPASPAPSAPAETPEPTAVPTPEPTAVPTPEPTAVPTPDPNDGGGDAMPIKVDLDNVTGADVYVDIVDGTGLLVGAESGTPRDGMSVEPYTLKVENVDASTLKLTWVDYPIDNALALYIDHHEGAVRLLLVQPEPTGPTDSIGFDRELVLSFSGPIAADQVDAFLQDGLDSPG